MACLASRLARRLLPNLPEEKRRLIESEIEVGASGDGGIGDSREH